MSLYWANLESFNANNSYYNVQERDCFILVNHNGHGNCGVILPSNTLPAKGYIVKEVSNLIVQANVSANTVNVIPLLITTDNSSS